ncbi:MAG TPA: SDR family oxidoreductase [Woeseiaceae bacterium]|nr:SDR family oxidoreductase [Woeseiaceae bacterium]
MPANNKNIVLISGGASGIGRRTAERFLAQGDAVHICDVSHELVDDFLAANPGATGTVADIGARDDVGCVFSDFQKLHDHLDVLVNNAGIAGPSAPIDKHDEDGWDKCIQVNLSGTFYMTRRAVPLLRQSGGGAIINVSSTAALHGYPLRSAYAASKWAMMGLMKTWAMELSPEGIRVNAVCPTSVEGDRIDAVIRREAEQRGLSFEQVREVYLRQTSMRTFVTPDDVADTILFLASDAANKISGQSLSVDGHTEGLSNWLD